MPQDENALLHQCAVDICGPPHQSPRYLMDNRDFENISTDLETSNLFNQRIRPAITKSLQREQKYHFGVLADFGEKFKNPQSTLSSAEYDQVAEMIFKNSKHSQNPLSSVYQKGLNSYTDNKITSKSFQSSPEFFDNSQQVLREEYQKFLTEHKEDISKWSHKDRDKLLHLNQRIQKARRKREINSVADDLEYLIRKAKGVSFCSSAECKEMVHSELKKMSHTFSLSAAEQKSKADQKIKYCESLFITKTMNAKKAKEFKDNIEKYKSKFINTFADLYSDSSKDNLQNFIDNKLDWSLPESSKEQVENVFLDDLNYYAQWRDKANSPYADKIQPIKAIMKNESMRESSPLCVNDLKDITDNIGTGSLQSSTVHVSHLSCVFPEVGQQTLAHEFAHLASFLFNRTQFSQMSYQKYKQLRDCATKRYKDNTFNPGGEWAIEHPATYHKNDRLRTEEDTADLFSYMAFQDDPTLANCSLLRLEEDGSKYKNLKLFYRSTMDPHSPALLRVLMEAIHKRKKLSLPCQQIIERYKDRINFKPCF